MKPIDKKDQPKLFALIGMAVLAFGFGAYQFAGSSTARPPAPGTAPTPAAQTAATEMAVGTAEEGGPWKPEGVELPLPAGGRDPFMPEGAGAPQPSPSPTPKATPAPLSDRLYPRNTVSPPLPPSIPRTGGPLVLNPPGPPKIDVKVIPAPTPTPPPPAPKLDLSGVLVAEDDSRSKAIFKSGERSKILGVGDAAGNGWRISDIKEGKVEITDPKTGRRAAVELK